MFTDALLHNAFYIPLAPFTAFVLILFFKDWLGGKGAWVGVLALLYAFSHALLIAIGIFNGVLTLPGEGLQGRYFEWAVPWFTSGNFEFTVGVLIDGLSSLMMVVVTTVALLVQIYSIAYMRHHKRFGLYFAYINLFTFSMLLLVVANNMLQFFVGWELVGLCSYLLIGFDFEREAAANAGRKAFITTKIADLGMYIGLLIIFNFLGTFHIVSLQNNVTSLAYPTWVLTAIPLLLFLGAMGKSAQVPFHVWLPDAMEGPTPASALIHAATMVAAGVYLVARVYFLFEAAPVTLEVVAWVGVITALIAASMGLVSSDIKRVLAFSTVSQLGFMMAALGCGGYMAGMFHLTTHAAFKALLFLCAGSVIHAVHTNDMWKMGGLATKMPITALTYLIATLAIAGLPPFSGFWSKEEVLAAAFHSNKTIFALLAFAALLTTFYMFRSFILTFVGMPRDKEKHHHAHESPFLMTGPLIALAVPSIFLGFAFWYHNNILSFVHWGTYAPATHGGSVVIVASLGAFILGLVGAFWVYHMVPPKHDQLARQFSGLYAVLLAKYKFDELYMWFIRVVYHPVSQKMADFDFNILDQGVVDGVGRLGWRFSWVGALFDNKVIDQFLIDGQGSWLRGLGLQLRRLQSGMVQSYLFWMIIGLGSMLVWMVQASSH